MPKLLTSILLLAAGLVASFAQPAFQPDSQYINELNNARARLQAQTPKLAKEELDQLATTLARSNRLAEIIPNLIFQYNFTNAAELLKKFPGSIDDLRRFGQPLVSSAVNDGGSVIFDFLLEHKARPEPANPEVDSYLIRALQYRRFDMASKLILAGASVTRTNSSGQSPAAVFFESWYPGSPADSSVNFLVPLLLARGLDPYAPIRPGAQNSILEECLARESGYFGAMRSSGAAPLTFFGELLLTNNPSPARRTPLGDTAIHLAARWEYTNAVRFLLTHGFTIDQTNAHGLTPLQGVVGSGAGGMVANIYYRAPAVASSNVPGTVRQAAPPPSITGWLLDHGAALDVFSAAGLGLTNELAALLRTNAPLANARDGFGRTPLHYAVLNAGGYPGFAYSFNGLGMSGRWSGPWSGPFSGQGFFVSPGLPQGATVQIPSVTNAPPPAIVMLLAAGADPSAGTTQAVPQQRNSTLLPMGSTPLHIAARNGNTAVIRLLLNFRANAKVADADGNTPLHLVSRTWQTNAIPMLLTAQASLEVTNLANQTPVRVAVESGVSTGVAVLLDAGANPTNGLGETTLMHLAAERGDVGTLTVLLKHNLALESRDRAGRTPLQKAIIAKNWNSITFLQGRGANLLATNFVGDTALHLVAALQDDSVYRLPDEPTLVRWQRSQLAKPGWTGRALNWLTTSKVLTPLPTLTWTNISLSTWLIERGAQVNATNRAGQTPLHSLFSAEWVRWQYPSAPYSNRVANLLNAGASLNAADTNGFTPLHLAATNVAVQTFKFLLTKAGLAAVNQPDRQGRTMLHRAVGSARDNFENVSTLITSGANVNAQDTNGATALHVLVSLPHDGWMYRRRELALMLLTNKANPNLTDKQGRTPLAIAMGRLSNYNEWNQREVITTLLMNGADPNIADRDGNTSMHRYFLVATTNNNVLNMHDGLQAALKTRADLTLTNHAGQTPLHLLLAGARQPYSHALHTLADYVTLTNAAFAVRDKDGNTLLHLWATNAPDCWQCGDALGRLLAIDGWAAATNFSGRTPLDFLSETGSRRQFVSRAIVAAAQNPAALAAANGQGQPLLHRVLSSLLQNNYEAQHLLRGVLTNRALVNLTNADGDTPWHMVIRNNSSSFWLRDLIGGVGRETFAVQNRQGKTPLHLLASSPGTNNHALHSLGEALAATSAAFTTHDENGDTPLHVWARSAANCNLCSTSLKRFLSVPANAAATNAAGQTPVGLVLLMLDRPWITQAALNTNISAAALKECDTNGQPLLHRLLASIDRPYPDGQQALRDLLQANQPLLSLTNRAGDTPLHMLIRSNNYGTIKALMDAGADPMAKDAQGQTALHLAPILSPISPVRPPGAKYSFFPAIRLNRMEDFNVWLAADPSLAGITNRDGDTPLMIASWLRRTNMIDRLLAMGVLVDPLSALRLGRIDAFRKVLLEAAHPVPDFWMFEAVRFGQIEALQPMIDAGANLHAVDDDGCSLVNIARRSKLDAVEDWLTAHGCHETFFDAIASGKRASVEKFMDSDKSLATTPNRRGVLPLCAAVIADRPESLKLLAEHGVALDVLLDSKWTPLHVAAVYDSVDCARFLLNSGVATNKLTASSNSALDLAAIFGSTNVAGLLIQNGMDVNVQPKGGFGNSPLHWAVHMGQLGMVKWLLAHGADLKLKNTRDKGETPLDLARLPSDAIGMGFSMPPEIRRNYPNRSRSPENCAEILKLLEAATANQN